MPATTKGRILVEVTVDSVAGAETAVAAGADRLELCSGLLEGGLTPSLGLAAAVREAVAVPVFAMLRPRSGDFLYSPAELAVLHGDLRALRNVGIDGFVAGFLTADGELDAAAFASLLELAGPAPLTCHRAFDLCADPFRALDTLLQLGVPRLLSSGQAAAAPAGAALLRALVDRAGQRLSVMAGAGVRPENARELLASSGCRELHLSATGWRPSGMRFRRAGVPMGSHPALDEYALRTTVGATVAAVVAIARDHERALATGSRPSGS